MRPPFDTFKVTPRGIIVSRVSVPLLKTPVCSKRSRQTADPLCESTIKMLLAFGNGIGWRIRGKGDLIGSLFLPPFATYHTKTGSRDE